jgi:nucleotidyltransferase/DNA polymerase involved in DNA repair
MFWRRKNRLERGLDSLEHGASGAVAQLAETVRDRLDNETGQQLAGSLQQLSQRVDELDLSDAVLKRRQELERAARKASKQVNRAIKDFDKTRGRIAKDANKLATRVSGQLEHGGQQIATIGHKSVPTEPTGWILPTLLGFMLGLGLGFMLARVSRRDRQEEHRDEPSS